MVELARYSKEEGLQSNLIAKVEYFNPLSSVKDRVGLAMIQDAEEKGLLKPGATIIEPTSGNTGVGLAFVSAIKGYKLILTMPESMSDERKKLLANLGAELILTPAKEGMSGSIAKAEELNKQIEGSIILGQFVNPANPAIHKKTTAVEIWNDTDGKVDYIVAGVGTGGTLTGVGEYFKEKNPNVKIIAVEPAESAVLSGKPKGTHGIQGIGAGFVPEILDTKVIDEIMPIETEAAYATLRKLAKTEGLFVGISASAAITAASIIAKTQKDKNIVVILPDTGERYLSLL